MGSKDCKCPEEHVVAAYLQEISTVHDASRNVQRPAFATALNKRTCPNDLPIPATRAMRVSLGACVLVQSEARTQACPLECRLTTGKMPRLVNPGNVEMLWGIATSQAKWRSQHAAAAWQDELRNVTRHQAHVDA